MRRLIMGSVVAFGAVLAVLVPAPRAFASKPHPDQPFTIPAAVCGFAVLVQIPVDGEQSNTTTLPDGTTVTRFQGAFKETLSNTITGKTISVNASGPGTVTQAPGSSVPPDRVARRGYHLRDEWSSNLGFQTSSTTPGLSTSIQTPRMTR